MDKVKYLDRYVSRETFRVYVYNKKGKKLVENYDDYKRLIKSGRWFATLSKVKR